MKILSVKLKNLNSLAGVWEIDFTDPVFASSGIFAIVGATGAGKTTILDAICLALFGCTPRLGKITAANNEIMSRHTGECSAEVVFETNRHGKFRCTWSQRRTGQKATGNLQPQTHQIAEADTGRIIETKTSLVPDVVEEKTGMNFNRFVRSMLLAQGEFAKFLQSSDGERGEILEQITGTEIYAEISKAVHARDKEENSKLNVLDEKLANITPLDDGELEKRREELDDLAKREKDAEDELKAIDVIINRYNNIGQLTAKKKSLDERRERLDKSVVAFRPAAERLAKALQAAALEPAFERLDTLRKELDKNLTEIAKVDAEIPKIEENVKEQIERERTASECVTIIQKEKEDRAPILRKVRDIDIKIETINKHLTEQGTRLADAEKNQTKQRKAVDDLEKTAVSLLQTFSGTFEQRLQDAQESHRVLEAELTALLQDRQISQIVTERTALEKQRENQRELSRLQQSIAASLEEKNQLADSLEILETKIKEAVSHRDSLQTVKETQALEIERLEEKLRLLDRIRSLEDERKHLIDGKPCPLCGATEHPYAEGSVPQRNETAVLLSETKKRRNENEEAIGNLSVHLAELQRDVEQNGKDQKANIAGTEKAQQQLADVLRQLGYDAPSDGTACQVEDLENRIVSLTQTVTDAEKIQGEIKESGPELQKAVRLRSDLAMERTRLQSLDEQVNGLNAEREGILQSRNELTDERQEIFGNENPDEEEQLRTEKETKALANHKKSQNDRQKAEQDLASLRGRLTTRNEAAQRCRTEIEAEGARFDALRSEKFESEQKFLDARLSAADRGKLETEKAELERNRNEIETLAKEYDGALKKEREAMPQDGDPPQKTVEMRKTELNDVLKTIRETRGALQERIAADKTLQKQWKEIREQRGRQAKESARWRLLDTLIGSADGKKFRTFAQGLTFRTMIHHANEQLTMMSDRYRLVPSEASGRPLELAVLDAYQANVVRPTKNLSGGESFLVSLALALGLSGMSSRNVRIDSLFLDEGFGTLDDQTLDTALSALDSLRQDGKQIGVISHVAAIRERIAAQIHVTRKAEGRSVIELPGT